MVATVLAVIAPVKIALHAKIVHVVNTMTKTWFATALK
jgi:hypothetical protein